MKIDPGMLVCTGEAKPLLIVGSLRELVPDEHILARADRVLDMQWLREVVRDRYVAGGTGCPGIDPEAAVRLMLAGFLPGNVHDRRLLRESDILPLLIARPGLRPVAALEEMRAHHPDHDWDRLRRTPERRVRARRAEHGPECEVIFRQHHPPGQQDLSDFTDMGELSIRIAGEPLAHRSRWPNPHTLPMLPIHATTTALPMVVVTQPN
jgi:hypothetical protein